MAETTGRAIEVFERSCRPRNFDEVCVLTLDDDCAAGDLAWFNAGVDSKVRGGILGFVFELNQFHPRESGEHGLGQMVRFMLPVMRGRASLYWLHGARFVEAWTRLNLLGIPPKNFESEREAVEALQIVLKVARIRADLPRRLVNCGLSPAQIANLTGLFEHVVQRIAFGQEQPSDSVTLLISSTLDSLNKGGVWKSKGSD